MLGGNVPYECVDVLDRGPKARAIAALSRRKAVTTGVPCEYVVVVESELVHEVLETARVLVSTMEQDDRAVARMYGRPTAIKETCAVMRGERELLCLARERRSVGVHRCAISERPPRTRFAIVRTRRPIIAAQTHANAGVTSTPSPNSRPSTPKTNARSLLPIGPS